ncbi:MULTISPECIES: hypothetical protein [unclassified Pseudomonas]|uniref:hypothetical protein n=1 Tax=unclassified Pseudomonas TaxID=196821 RepID=UPI001481D216|nr:MULTISPECIES: hypothetical protein [unclassified Pseudomonas]MDI2145746.1 hypothetical protein [Pseudomonas sp. ITA]
MRESDHDCVQPRDDFTYGYRDVGDTPAKDHNDDTKSVERTGKNQNSRLDSLGGGKLT